MSTMVCLTAMKHLWVNESSCNLQFYWCSFSGPTLAQLASYQQDFSYVIKRVVSFLNLEA